MNELEEEYLDQVEHPPILLRDKKSLEERIEWGENGTWVITEAVYSTDRKEIRIGNVQEKEVEEYLTHEFVHHLLQELIGEEATHKLDNITEIFDLFASPRIPCVYCRYFTPKGERYINEGNCEKLAKERERGYLHNEVRADDTCEDAEVDPIARKIPLSEAESWIKYRHGFEDGIFNLLNSDNEAVRERAEEEKERLHVGQEEEEISEEIEERRRVEALIEAGNQKKIKFL